MTDLVERLFERYPCDGCGGCCNYNPILTDGDVVRMAKGIGIGIPEFLEEYVIIIDDTRRLRGEPCPFRTDVGCSAYSHRPDVCRRFPFDGVVDGQLVMRLAAYCSITKRFVADYMECLGNRPYSRQEGMDWFRIGEFFGRRDLCKVLIVGFDAGIVEEMLGSSEKML